MVTARTFDVVFLYLYCALKLATAQRPNGSVYSFSTPVRTLKASTASLSNCTAHVMKLNILLMMTNLLSQTLLDAFTTKCCKKCACYLCHVCPSVCLSASKLRETLNGYSRNLILLSFTKPCTHIAIPVLFKILKQQRALHMKPYTRF